MQIPKPTREHYCQRTGAGSNQINLVQSKTHHLISYHAGVPRGANLPFVLHITWRSSATHILCTFLLLLDRTQYEGFSWHRPLCWTSKTKDIQLITWESTSRGCEMDPINLLNVPSLMPSLLMSSWPMLRWNQSLQRSPCSSMLSSMHLLSTLTWTTILLLASWTTSLRPQEATSSTLLIKLQSICLIQGSLMEKRYYDWYDTWRRPVILESGSSPTQRQVLNAIVMPTS